MPIKPTLAETGTVPAPTSVLDKLINLLVSPAVVFDEVRVQPWRPANWLLPTLLLCLSNLLVFEATVEPEAIGAGIRQLAQAGQLTVDQVSFLTRHGTMISRVAIGVAGFLGVLWSALALWFIGHFFLKTRFPLSKALEIVALSGTILVVGMVVTALLVLATGEPGARPSLSLLCLRGGASERLRAVGEVFNFFYLWTAVVLAIGLARLSRVRFVESAFWVIGYWVFLRLALLLLA